MSAFRHQLGGLRDGSTLCEPSPAPVKRRSGVAEDPVKNRNGSGEPVTSTVTSIARPGAGFRRLARLPQTGRTSVRPEPGAGVK